MTITDLISKMTTDPMVAAPLLLALVATAVIAAMPEGKKRNKLDDRLKSLHTTTYADLSSIEAALQASTLEEEEAPTTVGQRFASKAAEIIAPLPLVGDKEQAKIEQNLTRAGIRSHFGVPLFMLTKLAFFAVFAIGATVFFFANPDIEIPTVVRVLIVIAAAMVGGLMPEHLLKRIGHARSRRIANALPDAMDLMVICAEAGLSLEVALDRVAREMVMAAPDLSSEFTVTVAELQLLSDRRQALQNLANRSDLEMLRGVVTTLIQAQKYGTPLSQSLRVLGNEMRSARMLSVEEKAARMPALIAMPLIGLVLPALFMVIGGPAIIEVTRVFSGG